MHRMRGSRRPGITALVITALMLGAVAIHAPVARADTGDFGMMGPAWDGSVSAPTGEKPQHKTWWNDGS